MTRSSSFIIIHKKAEIRIPSSGVLTYIPRYGSITAKSYQPDILRPQMTAIRFISSDTGYNLTSHPIPTTLNGESHIEYSKITENIIKRTWIL